MNGERKWKFCKSESVGLERRMDAINFEHVGMAQICTARHTAEEKAFQTFTDVLTLECAR